MSKGKYQVELKVEKDEKSKEEIDKTCRIW